MQCRRSSLAVVCYEDRPSNEVGVQLLTLSLQKHFPSADVHVFLPRATPQFKQWSVSKPFTLHEKLESVQKGWDVKANLLQWGLDQGYPRVLFLDADIILARPPGQDMFDVSAETLVIAQMRRAARVYTHERTRAWNLAPGRSFLRDPTGCCMSVTLHHQALLHDWIALLGHPEYQRIQKIERTIRPNHARGSDDLLVALLGSKTYARLPIRFVSSSTEIAQCMEPGDFTPAMRLASLMRGLPVFVHAMGPKPWLTVDKDPLRIYSPYVTLAREYLQELPAGQDWLAAPAEPTGLWFRKTHRSAALATLPAAIRNELSYLGVRTLLKNLKYIVSGG